MNMDYFDFMMSLECIAVEKDLRLHIERAPVGCGFFFYFKKDGHDTWGRSDYIVWLNGKEEPESLFKRLRYIADTFNKTCYGRG